MLYEKRFRRDKYDSIDRTIDSEYINIALKVYDMCSDKVLAEELLSKLIYAVERDKTGVLNFRGFQERIKSSHVKNGNIIFFDLNNLKIVNDTLGHNAGDDYINTFITLMREYSIDLRLTFARIGGDEFLGYSSASTNAIEESIEQVNRTLNSRNIYYYVSYGIAQLRDNKELNKAISEADSNMYLHKRDSKSNK